MLEEIVPNLYRVEIPLPQSPLKWLNAYIIRGGDRFLIVDTGFNRDECHAALDDALRKLGVDLERTDFFITHIHSDHMGLLGRIAPEKCRIYFNVPEASWAQTPEERRKTHWERTLAGYIANGFEADAAFQAMASHPAHKYRSPRRLEFTTVADGDRIDSGDFHFRCLATPGHSPGHMVLYEEARKILIAGDHILFDITPNITSWVEMEDSLGQYLASLEKVDTLDAALVLPGHRRLVHDLHGRVRELREHHRARLAEVMEALGGGEKTVLEIAPHIHWDITARTWDAFPPAQKWFAFGETLAHVLYLEARGKIKRHSRGEKIVYRLA